MPSIIVKITVPEGVDPENMLEVMRDDFYYANRHSDDYGPHMENIVIDVIGTIADAPSED